MKKFAVSVLVVLAAVVFAVTVEGSVTLNHYKIELVNVEDNSLVKGGGQTTTLTYSVKGLVPKGAVYDDLHDLYIGACYEDIVGPTQGPQVIDGYQTYVSWIKDDTRTGVHGVRWAITDSFGAGDEAEFQITVRNYSGISPVNVAVWFGNLIWTNDYLEGHSCETAEPSPSPTPVPTPTYQTYVPLFTIEQGVIR